LVKLGNYLLAEQCAREALVHRPKTAEAELVYKVARIYAQLAGSVEAGKRRQYLEVALRQRQKALDLASDETKHAELRESMQADPAWSVLRRK
jgi:hypothetical protein